MWKWKLPVEFVQSSKSTREYQQFCQPINIDRYDKTEVKLKHEDKDALPRWDFHNDGWESSANPSWLAKVCADLTGFWDRPF